jgi:hypothetical protein
VLISYTQLKHFGLGHEQRLIDPTRRVIDVNRLAAIAEQSFSIVTNRREPSLNLSRIERLLQPPRCAVDDQVLWLRDVTVGARVSKRHHLKLLGVSPAVNTIVR